MAKNEPNYWVFSNKPAGSYGNLWDLEATLKTKRYYFREDERNRRKVKPGDVVILRIFGLGYIGTFLVGEWHQADDWNTSDGRKVRVGYFEMKKVDLWKRELPQPLILRELSTKDFRNRLVRVTAEDVIKIDTARRLY